MFARPASPAPSEVTVVPPPGSSVGSATPGSFPVELDAEDGYSSPEYIKLIRLDKINCGVGCICKLKRLNLIRPRSPPKEVISHKVKDGICFLLCILDSPAAIPTYLRQCQVPRELRLDYYEYLREFGGPKNLSDYWNIEKEMKMRNALMKNMTPEQRRVQEEIIKCVDTVDWDLKTNNGKMAASSSTSTFPSIPRETTPIQIQNLKPNRQKSKQGMRVKEILGFRRVRGLLTFLVKWEGLSDEECSWISAEKVGNAQMIESFFEIYGKPGKSSSASLLTADGKKVQVKRIKNKDNSSGEVSVERSIEESITRYRLPTDN